MYATHCLFVINPCAKYLIPVSNQKQLWAAHKFLQTEEQTKWFLYISLNVVQRVIINLNSPFFNIVRLNHYSSRGGGGAKVNFTHWKGNQLPFILMPVTHEITSPRTRTFLSIHKHWPNEYEWLHRNVDFGPLVLNNRIEMRMMLGRWTTSVQRSVLEIFASVRKIIRTII